MASSGASAVEPPPGRRGGPVERSRLDVIVNAAGEPSTTVRRCIRLPQWTLPAVRLLTAPNFRSNPASSARAPIVIGEQRAWSPPTVVTTPPLATT